MAYTPEKTSTGLTVISADYEGLPFSSKKGASKEKILVFGYANPPNPCGEKKSPLHREREHTQELFPYPQSRHKSCTAGTRESDSYFPL